MASGTTIETAMRMASDDDRDDRQPVAEEPLANELPVGPDRDEIDLVDLGRERQRAGAGTDVDAHRSPLST